MKFFIDYSKAKSFAIKQVQIIGVAHGIEKTSEFGVKGFTVKMLPKKENRFGHELTIEPLEAGEW